MIGRLRGTLALKSAEEVIVDVGGVGYSVSCPLTTLDALPPQGEVAHLVVHTHVREDQLMLFGFATRQERALFRLLIGISGVGPKIALACLSGLDANKVVRAILEEDVRTLSGVPGIGKRTAERIILELKEKVQGLGAAAAAAAPGGSPHLDDLESALRNLGFRQKDVDNLVKELGEGAAERSFEELLREALRQLSG